MAPSNASLRKQCSVRKGKPAVMCPHLIPKNAVLRVLRLDWAMVKEFRKIATKNGLAGITLDLGCSLHHETHVFHPLAYFLYVV